MPGIFIKRACRTPEGSSRSAMRMSSASMSCSAASSRRSCIVSRKRSFAEVAECKVDAGGPAA
jgi:hypothetical protein